MPDQVVFAAARLGEVLDAFVAKIGISGSTAFRGVGKKSRGRGSNLFLSRLLTRCLPCPCRETSGS